MRTLLKGSLALAIANVFVRLLTLYLYSAMTARFGTGAVSDGFLIGMTLVSVFLPVATSALSTVYIPILAQGMQTGYQLRRETRRLLIKSACLGAGVLAVSPWIPFLLAPDISGAGYDVAVTIVRWSAPVVALTLASSLPTAYALLNERYLAITVGNVLASAGPPLFLFLFSEQMGVASAAVGSFVGVALQSLLLYVVLPMGTTGTPETGMNSHIRSTEVLGKAIPLILSGISASIGQVLLRGMASGLDESTMTYLSYGLRIVTIPVGIISTPFVISAHAALTKENAKGGHLARKALTIISLLVAFSFTSIAIVAGVASELTRLLFEYGKFSGNDTVETARAVVALTPALLLLPLWDLGNRLLVTFGHARRLLYMSLLATLINLGASWALKGPLGGMGLALGMVLGQLAAVGFIYWQILSDMFQRLPWVRTSFSFVILSIGTLGVASLIRKLMELWDPLSGTVGLGLKLIGGAALGSIPLGLVLLVSIRQGKFSLSTLRK